MVWLHSVITDSKLKDAHDWAYCLLWNTGNKFYRSKNEDAAYNLADAVPNIEDRECFTKYLESMDADVADIVLKIIRHPQFDAPSFIFAFTRYDVCRNGTYYKFS